MNEKEKKPKVKLILHSQKLSQPKYNEHLESLHTQQTISKQNSIRQSNTNTNTNTNSNTNSNGSQFTTLFSNKMSTKNNQSNNLFSTFMKPKKGNTKHHHISCHQISTNIDRNKLNTLNLSTKHMKSNSPDNLSLDKTVSKLNKDNKDLLAKMKEQENTINDILNQRKQLQAKYDLSEKKRKILQEEIEILKANETQLMTILYVLEEKGIPIESIIDKWNQENEPSKTNRSLESAAFTPITLELQPKCLTKIDNIPKLDFNSINVNTLHRSKATNGDDNNPKKKRSSSQK